jgi:hypothetical protein
LLLVTSVKQEIKFEDGSSVFRVLTVDMLSVTGQPILAGTACACAAPSPYILLRIYER